MVDNTKVTAIEITKSTTTTAPTAYTSTVDIRDSVTNCLLKTYSDVFTTPVKVVIKN